MSSSCGALVASSPRRVGAVEGEFTNEPRDLRKCHGRPASHTRGRPDHTTAARGELPIAVEHYSVPKASS